MKTFTTIGVMFITGLSLSGQPVFETTFNESATICTLESAGEVYYSMDVINRQCHIYRMDRTLYKSVPLPVPEGYYLADVRHVSEKLFNDDNLVELVYIYSKYVVTTDSYYYTFESRLIDENGTVVLTFPGAGYTEVFETVSHGKKFLVYEYDYSVIPWRTYTHVYALPEAPSKSGTAILPENQGSRAFPNPATGLVHIPVELPTGISTGYLEVTGMHGATVMRMPVTSADMHLVLPVYDLPPGSYLYHIRSAGSVLSSGKLLVER